METQIKIAAKLYECRDTAKRFFREEYAEKLKPYINLIKAVMERNELDVLPAVLKITSETVNDNGFGTMMFMAGAVELMEPSEEYLNQTKEQ